MLLAAMQALCACANHPDATAPTGPAVPMPGIQASIDNSTPEVAQRGMSNKTWLWTRGGGPYQVHYSTADGRDFAWLVGESRILRGEWRIDTATGGLTHPVDPVFGGFTGNERLRLGDSLLGGRIDPSDTRTVRSARALFDVSC